MRILWICNLVVPEVGRVFGFKTPFSGGWFSNMLEALCEDSEIEIGICCPILDKSRMQDGKTEKVAFYSFQFIDGAEVSEQTILRFKEILSSFEPDVIHIWGTEYSHSNAMVRACEELDVIDKVLVDIQGLVSRYGLLMGQGIPQEEVYSPYQKDFESKAKNEIETINMVRYAAGRTDWTEACVKQINPNIRYFSCWRIHHDLYVEAAGSWNYKKCEKHSIFLSQWNYPIKGMHFIVKAFPLILQKYPDTKIYCAGSYSKDDLYVQYIMNMIDVANLSNNIIFMGILQKQEMISMYQRANVFVSSSVIEASANSICEAMLIGVPVVASYVGGVTSLIRHGVDGFLYPLNEEYMLAYYICRIFEDVDMANKFSQQGSSVARKRGNKEVNSKKMKDIYSEICRYSG